MNILFCINYIDYAIPNRYHMLKYRNDLPIPWGANRSNALSLNTGGTHQTSSSIVAVSTLQTG